MFGVDPYDEHEERAEEHEGNHGGNTRESLKPTRLITQMLDPGNTRGDTRSMINKGRYTVTGSSPIEVLSSSLKRGLESAWGIFSGGGSNLRGEVTKWMSMALTQNMS